MRQSLLMYAREHNSAVSDAVTRMIKGSAHAASQAHLHSVFEAMHKARMNDVHRVENFSLWSKYPPYKHPRGSGGPPDDAPGFAQRAFGAWHTCAAERWMAKLILRFA